MPSQLTPIAAVGARKGAAAEHADAVRAMFDRIAPTYDGLNHALSGGLDVLWRRRVVAEVTRARRSLSGPILDLCAGTLDLAAALARRFPDERIVAVDFAAEMLERGRPKAPRVTTLVADAESLPLPSESFAACVCGFGIRNLAHPERGLREVRRILKPGGVFLTLELFQPTGAVHRALHATYCAHVLPRIGGWVSGQPAAYQYLAESMAQFDSRNAYEQRLRDEGFTEVRGESFAFGMAGLVRAEVPR